MNELNKYSFIASLADFENNMVTMYGEQGKQWLATLPETVKAYASRWNLSDLAPINSCFYNYVLTGKQNDQPIVLKMGLDVDKLRKEVRALKAFEGHYAVRVLTYSIDETQGALLLERAVPGTTLLSLFPNRDDEAIDIICDVVKNLPQPPLCELETFQSPIDRLSILDKPWNIPAPYLEKARHLRALLLASAPQPRLIHGDLHHANILQHGDRWIVIDPTGNQGEMAYDVVLGIVNPYDDLSKREDAFSILAHRIKRTAANLSLDAERIQRWCYIHGILAWCWFLDDGIDPSEIAGMVEKFYSLTPPDLETPSPLLK